MVSIARIERLLDAAYRKQTYPGAVWAPATRTALMLGKRSVSSIPTIRICRCCKTPSSMSPA
jgi:hypothetical protein